MATRAVLAPFTEDEAIELGNRYWRKQVLRHGDYAYEGGRTLRFTPDYTAALARAYRERAYDAVPLQFAGPDNRHTNAIEATRGEIVGLESTAEGLDAIMSLEPEAEAVVRRHPRLPVSVRIVENLDRADGKAWPAAVQHVLATWDPRVTAMKPWERVELASDGVERVVDLTEPTVARPGATTQEGTTMPQLADAFSDEEIAKLRALLAEDKDTSEGADGTDTTAAPAPDAAGPEDGYVIPSDEELDRIARVLYPGETGQPEGQPAGETAAEAGEVTATAGDPQVVEMASRLSAIEAENAKLRAAADEAAYEKLRDDLARGSGIPPAITDLAKPLLTGAHVIEVSGGQKVNAGEVIHKVLTAIGEQAKLLDLSGPVAFGQTESDADHAADGERRSFAEQYARDFGLR
jgi:hypothetical protein